VPLFVEELTKTVIESNLIEVRGDQYTLTGPLTKLAIPSTLHDSLMARLDRLAPVREVAQIAAVIGREFSHRVLAAVSPLTEEALEDAMAQLMNAALVFRRGTPQRAQYIFKHALVRDAAYESLLKRKRRELHGRIAEALEIELAETVESEPELLAHHYTESGLIERALPNWLRAGQKAVEHGANKEAATHLRRGLELLVTVPNNDALTRLEISFRVALGVPLLNIEGAGSPEFADNYSRAQTLCEKVGDTEQQFPVVWGMWFHAMMSSDIRRACELGDKLLEVAEQQNDESLLLEAHHCQWPSRFLMGDMNGTLHHSDRGRKLYNADVHHALTFTYGGHDPGVCARNMGSMALYLTGYPDQAKERSEEGLELARCLGHAGSLSEALSFAIYISLMTSDVRAVEQYADALEENSQSEQLQIYQIFVDTARGYVLTQKRLVDQGLVRIREAIKSLTPGGVWEEPLLSLVASTIGQHGEIERGRELVDKALKLAQQRDIRWWEAEFHRVQGELLLANGSDDTAGAEHCLKEAIDVARRQRAKSLELRATISLVRVWRDLDKPRTAHELLVPLYEWFTEGFDTPDLKEAKALLNELV